MKHLKYVVKGVKALQQKASQSHVFQIETQMHGQVYVDAVYGRRTRFLDESKEAREMDLSMVRPSTLDAVRKSSEKMF